MSSLVVGCLLQPTSSLLQPTVRPRLASARLRMTSSEAQDVDPPKVKATPWLPAYTVPEPGGRYPYTLTDLPRPVWRGRMMGWLHKTRLWYLLAVVYVALAVRLKKTPLDVGIRAAAAIATSANIFISDGYHNGDKRGTRRRNEAYDPTVERQWLKWDYVGISAILATQYWLWASNFGWVRRLQLGGWLSGVALALVVALSKLVVPRKAGHAAVKAVMGVQFVGLLGYLVSTAYFVGPAVNRLNTLVFAAYAPGLVCYVLKQPKSSAAQRRPRSGHGVPSSKPWQRAASVWPTVRRGCEARGAHAADRLLCAPPASPTRRAHSTGLRTEPDPAPEPEPEPEPGVWLPRDLPHERHPGAQHQHDLRPTLGAVALGLLLLDRRGDDPHLHATFRGPPPPHGPRPQSPSSIAQCGIPRPLESPRGYIKWMSRRSNAHFFCESSLLRINHNGTHPTHSLRSTD